MIIPDVLFAELVESLKAVLEIRPPLASREEAAAELRVDLALAAIRNLST
jgi:hypothetical protein